MKIVYHCFSCKKDFVDIDLAKDLAKEHSKSLDHEVAEETRLADKDQSDGFQRIDDYDCRDPSVVITNRNWIRIYGLIIHRHMGSVKMTSYQTKVREHSICRRNYGRRNPVT